MSNTSEESESEGEPSMVKASSVIPETGATVSDKYLEDSDNVKRWLDFCRAHSQVKCVEYDVPSGILPKNYTGVLIDVKVGGHKRRPDDKIYLAHEELRQKVARGNCVLELHKLEKGKISSTVYIFLVFALKKFSGGLGDEDDCTSSLSDWTHYFTKPLSSAFRIISTEKANGEAAHVSSLKLFGMTYLCIGSKNVHMLVRNTDDIQKYKDGRFQVARHVSLTFFHTFMDNTEISAEQKESFLSHVQKNHYTTVFEILQPVHQHVVNLSYLKRPVLKFICWTRPDFEEDFSSRNTLCSIPVNEAIDKARDLGLTTIEYEEINLGGDVMHKIESYMRKIRADHGYEGKVLYFLDKENFTIGLIKKKTAWYIILRALREKVAAARYSKTSTSWTEQETKIRKRLKEIQSWLEFSDGFAEQWIEISTSFAKWVHLRRETREIRPNFPIIFDDFLRHNEDIRKKYDSLLDDHEELFG